jgi:hypothetical protein
VSDHSLSQILCDVQIGKYLILEVDTETVSDSTTPLLYYSTTPYCVSFDSLLSIAHYCVCVCMCVYVCVCVCMYVCVYVGHYEDFK